MLIGLVVFLFGFYGVEVKKIVVGEYVVLRVWVYYVVGIVLVILIIIWVGGILFWMYVFVVVYLVMSLLML